jgi:magnesium transporter
MIVDAAHYVLGVRQQGEAISLEQASACPRTGSSFTWITLHEPAVALMREVQALFELHELAVEDAEHAHERPKLEQFDAFHYIVLCTAQFDEERMEVEFGEVHLFVAPGYVIEVRHGCATRAARARKLLEGRPQLLKSGPAAVVWGVLDEVVDGYRPVLAGLESDIAEIERSVFRGTDDPTERIYLLTQEVSAFYRVTHPLLAPLDALERGVSFGEIDPALRSYFRDVNDHLKLVHDEILAQRDQLAGVLAANVALINLRQNAISAVQNDTMKKLTALATVFLPITFVTGFFGQNFSYMIDHLTSSAAAFVAGTALQVGVVAAILVFFRRRDWL